MKDHGRVEMDTAKCGNCNCNCVKTHFNWSAVIVAALVGIGLSFLFTLLAIAFGFTAFSMDAAGATVFSTGGFISLVVIAVIAMFMVGWTAGCLARPFCIRKYDGELYGFTAWCLTIILSILLAASSAKLISNTSYMVNKSLAPITATVSAEKVSSKIPALKNETSVEKNAEVAAATSFVTFFLFFIGALLSSFGGRCAMHCKKRGQ